jgi:hypothetical protein
MIVNDFAVFILTHGRPNNVRTFSTLRTAGYTGKIVLICDNEDGSLNQYIALFGSEAVKVFNKQAIADEADEGNNFDERRTILHARNACFLIAKEIGVKYFVQLDDDYTSFRFRYVNKYVTKGAPRNLDRVFAAYLNLYKSIAAHSIAFAQGGDFIGGASCGMLSNYRRNARKCMNSFFCSTDRPFKFVGAMNEDVNTYSTLGSRGAVFLTLPFIGLEQAPTQAQSGGITDMYLRFGTFCKGFTTAIMHPSGAKVAMMGFTTNRLHHRINWNNTTPMIIRETYKK